MTTTQNDTQIKIYWDTTKSVGWSFRLIQGDTEESGELGSHDPDESDDSIMDQARSDLSVLGLCETEDFDAAEIEVVRELIWKMRRFRDGAAHYANVSGFGMLEIERVSGGFKLRPLHYVTTAGRHYPHPMIGIFARLREAKDAAQEWANNR